MAKILIVDDEESIRQTLAEFVREGGYEVLTARDALEALRTLESDAPDVVITDLILPRIDGVELLHRIKEASAETQVVMLTGEPTVETASDAVREGAFDYLTKPVSRGSLLSAVTSAVRVKELADVRLRLEQENLRYRDHLEEEVAAKTEALRATESEYRALFEDSPVALWHEDFSLVKRRIDQLAAEGVRDFAAYFAEHPDVVRECIELVRIVDVNSAALAMHEATSKNELLTGLSQLLTPTSVELFTQQLHAIAEGKSVFEGVTLDQTLAGAPVHVSIRWSVPAAYRGTLERVLVSKIDVTRTVEAEQRLRRALDGTIAAIGLTTEMRDPYTAGHQLRMTELAVAIAHELGLDEATTNGVKAAGLIHDIGKMAVPAEILSKPSPLSEMERELIRAHSQAACDILKTVTLPWPVAEIVLQHHERLDGSGYPRALLREDLLIEARILAVADVVEAMASHRPYRAALGIDAALEEISKNRGTLYDPAVVDACIHLFKEEGFKFSA